MNRASTTNGDASAALAKGGYDAYFAQLGEPPGDNEAASAPPSSGGDRAGAAVPADTGSPAVPEQPADRTGSAVAPDPAPPATTGPSSISVAPEPASAPGPQPLAEPPIPTPPPGATAEEDMAELRQRAVTAHQQAAEQERQAIARRQQQQNPQGPAMGTPAPQAQADPATSAPEGWAAPQEYTESRSVGSEEVGTAPTYTATPGYAGQPPAHPGYASSPPAAAAADTSRVPDRIQRPAYETTNRVEVLPPALASAELLAEIAAVRQAHLRSSKGMRGALNKVGFNLGLSPAEQRAESRRNQIRRQLTAPYQIAVVSVKGGVGRTTVAAGLGSTFAKLRPDRVVAIDANPDFGDLASRTSRHQFGLTLRDLAQAGGRLESFSSVHSYTAVNTADLAVVASPWSTDASEALTGSEYQTGVETLRRHYNLLLVDCGTGVLDSSTNQVLRTSDAVVVVTPATVGGVTGAVATLNWLSSHGFDRLIATSVVAIVRQHPAKPTVDIEAIEKLFVSAQRPTIRVPYDPHLAEGGEIDLRMLEKETVLAFEDLAAELADDFPGYVAEQSGGNYGGMR
ncbi:AAA family ATPase [Nocardia sp. NPDC019395]|uniref:AAA family ATPase n=1 Tax=Nocardia sp. NPDC019395 TaxID=3154686 RepID=UPI0033FACBD6